MNEIDESSIGIIVTGRCINLFSLATRLNLQYFTQQYKDFLFIDNDSYQAVIFDYGVVITWAMDEIKRRKLLEKVLVCTNQKHEILDWECYQFNIDDNGPVFVNNDVIRIPNIEPLTLISVSHALAQSATLEYFENIAEKTVKDNAHLSEMLAKTGKIPLSRKALAKRRGSLFQTKSDILLHFNLLDTPEFFWDYPNLESSYNTVAKYLELTPRVELLTLKLETIKELLEILAIDQNHKHSAALEWIIIVLIALDIAVYFGH